jgi:hypothetical protein
MEVSREFRDIFVAQIPRIHILSRSMDQMGRMCHFGFHLAGESPYVCQDEVNKFPASKIRPFLKTSSRSSGTSSD